MVWKAHKQTKQWIEIEIHEINDWFEQTESKDRLFDRLKHGPEKEARRNKLREVLKLLNQT